MNRLSRDGFRGDMGEGTESGGAGLKGREEWLQRGVCWSTADQLSAARVRRDCCCRVVPDACRALRGGWVGARLPTLTESGGCCVTAEAEYAFAKHKTRRRRA
jgi:hypothetical protein